MLVKKHQHPQAGKGDRGHKKKPAIAGRFYKDETLKSLLINVIRPISRTVEDVSDISLTDLGSNRSCSDRT